jgi:hypothetical protein
MNGAGRGEKMVDRRVFGDTEPEEHERFDVELHSLSEGRDIAIRSPFSVEAWIQDDDCALLHRK